MTIATDEHERTMAFAEIAFGQIRALHQTLNHAMKREVEHLMALGDAVRPQHPVNRVMIEEEVL